MAGRLQRGALANHDSVWQRPSKGFQREHFRIEVARGLLHFTRIVAVVKDSRDKAVRLNRTVRPSDTADFHFQLCVQRREESLLPISALFEFEFVHDDLVLGEQQGEFQRETTEKTPRLSPGRFNFQKALARPGLVATSAATTAATATATVAAATTAAVALTRSTCGEVFARTRFVHGEVATMEVLAVELADRRLCLSIAGHGDEAEAAGVSGHFILHEGCLGDAAGACKEILKIVFGGVEGKIPDV